MLCVVENELSQPALGDRYSSFRYRRARACAFESPQSKPFKEIVVGDEKLFCAYPAPSSTKSGVVKWRRSVSSIDGVSVASDDDKADGDAPMRVRYNHYEISISR